MIHLREATATDARVLADLLNEIIEIGGTTAITEPLSRADMTDWISSNTAQSAWILAEDHAGEVLGFQTIGPHERLPKEACDIATFTRHGHAQLGIASRLFGQTMKRARALEYDWINATVRRVNEGGLIYYKSRGFEPWKREPERLSLRFDLR